MSYRKKEFDGLHEEFLDAAATFFDESTIKAFEFVLDCYNAIIVYAEIDYDRKKKCTKEYIEDTIRTNRVTLQKCFERLNIPVTLPGKLLSTIHYVQSEQKSNITSGQSTQTDEIELIGQETETEPIPQSSTGIQTDQVTLLNQITQTITMAQTKSEFLKMAASLINYKFEGDPLKLASFLADVDMVVETTEEANKTSCVKFIKRCLSGKALECIPEDADTVDKIKDALKENIKPESSDVVEGKLMALRVKKGDFTEFTQEAEKLAEAFRRSLVVSGITKAKAQEMTIKKTIELCRKTARSDVVKSVISSSKYEQPADVLATLVTQNDVARKEKAETDAYKAKTQSKSSGFQNRGGKFNGRGGNRGNYSGRGGNNYRQQNSQNGNRDQQPRRNGNFRGNGQNRGFQNKNSRNEHTIRFVSGNSMGPMQGQLGFPQQQPLQQQQPQQDQIFQIPFH